MGLLGRAEERVLEFQVCCESAWAFLPVTWPQDRLAGWVCPVDAHENGWLFFMCPR